MISGREVFEFRPELVDDDDEEADDTHDTQGRGGDEVDDSVSVNDIDLSLYIPRDVGETGITVASLERFSTYTSEKDWNKLSEASGGRAENGERSDLEEDKKGGRQQNGAIDAVPVDENLFTGEDLDELEELNTLDLEEWHQTSQWKNWASSAGVEIDYINFFPPRTLQQDVCFPCWFWRA